MNIDMDHYQLLIEREGRFKPNDPKIASYKKR